MEKKTKGRDTSGEKGRDDGDWNGEKGKGGNWSGEKD